MRDLGAEDPDGVGVVDLKRKHVRRGREAAEDDVGGRSLAGIGEVGARHGVAGREAELDRIAHRGGEGVGREDESVLAYSYFVDVGC